MINKIVSGISTEIFNEFGEGYEIYIEDLTQGFKAPCFLIANKSESRKIYLGKTFRNKTEFCVMYHPSSADKRVECSVASDRLFECLAIIEIEGEKFRSYGLSSKIEDNVLYFNFCIDIYYEKVEETELMEVLELEEKL